MKQVLLVVTGGHMLHHFEWSVLDTPMQRYRERGYKTSFRITCSDTPFPYATPKWVEEAGAKGYRYTPGKGEQPNGSHWEPDFNDPIFLEKLDHLLAKLAERYDGHPDVELFDIGSYGTWGEGHTWASTRRAYPDDVILKHMDVSNTRIVLVSVPEIVEKIFELIHFSILLTFPSLRLAS